MLHFSNPHDKNSWNRTASRPSPHHDDKKGGGCPLECLQGDQEPLWSFSLETPHLTIKSIVISFGHTDPDQIGQEYSGSRDVSCHIILVGTKLNTLYPLYDEGCIFSKKSFGYRRQNMPN